MAAFIIRTAINAAALVVAALVVQWAHRQGFIGGTIILEGAETALLTALVFGLLNALIRRVVLFFTCLVNVLTLGLFTLIVNALMLLLTSWVVGQINETLGTSIAFSVTGFLAAFLGAVIISVVSAVLTKVIR